MGDVQAKATVYVGDEPTANLDRTNSGCILRYLPDCVGTGGPAVCLTMPVRDEPYEFVGDTLPPFFCGPVARGFAARRAAAKSQDVPKRLIRPPDASWR
ncbi:MAG: HipA N-terminal domain-containing protein [Armatimonadetes bacterium]|nr:HipA N-terminal domain-containing protein [Armatimonadota bacterium]